MKIKNTKISQRKSLKLPINLYQTSLCSFQKKKKTSKNPLNGEKLFKQLSKTLLKKSIKQDSSSSLQKKSMQTNLGRLSLNQKKMLKSQQKLFKKKHDKITSGNISLVNDLSKINKLELKKTKTDSKKIDSNIKIHNSTFETEFTEKTNQDDIVKITTINHSTKRKAIQEKPLTNQDQLQIQALLYFQYYTKNILNKEKFESIQQLFNKQNKNSKNEIDRQLKQDLQKEFDKFQEWKKQY